MTKASSKPPKADKTSPNPETDFLDTRLTRGPWIWFGLLLLPLVASVLTLFFGWLTDGGAPISEKPVSVSAIEQPAKVLNGQQTDDAGHLRRRPPNPAK